MMKCLTVECGQWSGGRWMPQGMATIHADLVGAVVDVETYGCQLLGAGFAISVNIPREKVVQMIRNAEAGRLDFGVVS